MTPRLCLCQRGLRTFSPRGKEETSFERETPSLDGGTIIHVCFKCPVHDANDADDADADGQDENSLFKEDDDGDDDDDDEENL